MTAVAIQPRNLPRLEQQTRRLRNALARAWEYQRPGHVITRLETLLDRRWHMLDQARRDESREPPD